ERFHVGASYVEVVQQLRKRFEKPELERSPMCVDRTAVGQAVYDMFVAARLPASLIPVAMTVGGAADRDDSGTWRVSRRDLVAALQTAFQEKRLHIGKSLEHTKTLVDELNRFQLKPVPLDPSRIEWREHPTEDVLFAV